MKEESQTLFLEFDISNILSNKYIYYNEDESIIKFFTFDNSYTAMNSFVLCNTKFLN